MTISKECLARWNTTAFAESFLAEMRENGSELPLIEVCEEGGYVKAGTVELKAIKTDGGENGFVNGEFHFSFTQHVQLGCSDTEKSYPVSGTMFFTLRLWDGVVTFAVSSMYGMSGE